MGEGEGGGGRPFCPRPLSLPPPSLSDPLPPLYPSTFYLPLPHHRLHLLYCGRAVKRPRHTAFGVGSVAWYLPVPLNVFQFSFPSSPPSLSVLVCTLVESTLLRFISLLHSAVSLPVRSSPYHYLAIGPLIVKEVLKVQKAAGERGTKEAPGDGQVNLFRN